MTSFEAGYRRYVVAGKSRFPCSRRAFVTSPDLPDLGAPPRRRMGTTVPPDVSASSARAIRVFR